MEEVNSIASTIVGYYNNFIEYLPNYGKDFFNFLILVLLVVIYSIFIWKFYRFISRKNIIELNLNQYNKYKHDVLAKLVAGFLYFIEYIIILPFLIFFWYAIFTLLLIILSQSQDTSQILLISAVVIAAIRMTAYYKENLSQDVAKLLPLTLLAVSVLDPDLFIGSYFASLVNHLTRLPEFFVQIVYYLAFIIFLEILLRFFDFIFSLFGQEEDKGIEKIKEED